MKAQLILENGTRFTGTLFGADRNVVGEVVFTTGVVGYQETLTDPSLTGQIVTMTFPLIGNYGINFEDMEAEKASPKALVVREKCDYPSNFRNEMNLDDFLRQQGVVGLEGIDTRALTRLIRDEGVMKGVIMMGEPRDEDVKILMNSLDNSNVIAETTSKEIHTVNESGKTRIAFIDLGTKQCIIDDLVKRDCSLTVFPADTSAEKIEAAKPDMVFVSSGPGNPNDATAAIETVKALSEKYPIFGVGLGHQIIGLALGCKTEKLKFGHHGGNYPVKDMRTGSVFITSQNHLYALTDLPADVEEIFVNVNDGTCQGIKHKSLPIESIEFQPNALYGAGGTGWIFDKFLKEVR